MRYLLAALLLALVFTTAGGCCVCGPNTPVSFEPLCNCLRYHGLAPKDYPCGCAPSPPPPVVGQAAPPAPPSGAVTGQAE